MSRLVALPLALVLQVWPSTGTGIWLLMGAVVGIAIACVCVRHVEETSCRLPSS